MAQYRSTGDAKKDRFYQSFKQLAGEDNEIDAWELQDLLNSVMKRDSDLGDANFSIDSCKSMVAMTDSDRSGKLGFEEFMDLWKSILAWRNVFKQFDCDNSGSFSAKELHLALSAVGYQLNPKIFAAMVLRYTNKESQITFDNFMACAAKLRHMYHVFRKYKGSDDKASLGLDEYLRVTIYS
ncbi:calpain small subunit 2-like [Amphiura filiformis]|uniref:calpain small subunit 2-like n=1 Tax=Amphiura filiformis TaxID=82378 RepID=UPI003B20EFAA